MPAIGAIVSVGGLGDWVVTGIQLFNNPQILAGAILAILFDTILVVKRNRNAQTSGPTVSARAVPRPVQRSASTFCAMVSQFISPTG